MVEASKIKLENNIQRIIEAIYLDKPLNPTSNLSKPCSICNKNCLKNQCHLACKGCGKSCHIKCDGTNLTEYRFYLTNNDDPSNTWYCLYCTLFFHYDVFSFYFMQYIRITKY